MFAERQEVVGIVDCEKSYTYVPPKMYLSGVFWGSRNGGSGLPFSEGQNSTRELPSEMRRTSKLQRTMTSKACMAREMTNTRVETIYNWLENAMHALETL